MNKTPVTPQDFPEIRWKGHWIWAPEDKVEFGMGLGGMVGIEPRKESHGLFRKRFTLAAVPKRVPRASPPTRATRCTSMSAKSRAGRCAASHGA